METTNSKNRALVDITSLLAAILPIAQLAFIYLPDSLTAIYLQQEAFLGVSLVTLVLSYVSIVAYKSRPWFVFVFPWHKKKMSAYNDWQQKMYEASSAMKVVQGEQPSKRKIELFLEELKKENLQRPFQINNENRIGIFVFLLFINAISFLIIGLSNNLNWLSSLQSLNYFFMIILSVLILVIYRDTNNNNKRYNEELRIGTSRAINLAIDNNCFMLKPQVKFISTHGGEGMDRFVRVEFGEDQYEICTNSDATKLIYCYKLTTQPQ